MREPTEHVACALADEVPCAHDYYACAVYTLRAHRLMAPRIGPFVLVRTLHHCWPLLLASASLNDRHADTLTDLHQNCLKSVRARPNSKGQSLCALPHRARLLGKVDQVCTAHGKPRGCQRTPRAQSAMASRRCLIRVADATRSCGAFSESSLNAPTSSLAASGR